MFSRLENDSGKLIDTILKVFFFLLYALITDVYNFRVTIIGKQPEVGLQERY